MVRSGKVNEDTLSLMAQCLLQGMSQRQTAKKCGIDESTVRYHLENTLQPRWRQSRQGAFDTNIAKIDMIERIAWERFYANEPGETARQIEKALTKKTGKLRIVKDAVRTVTTTGSTAWIQIVEWCVEFRSKMYGWQPPAEHKITIGGELRVAGQSPSDVDQAMLQRLMEKIAERRQYQAALGWGEELTWRESTGCS